jgi:fructose-specific phosphotransferase system IIC component
VLAKYLPIISVIFLLAAILSLWFYPFMTPALGVAALLFSLAASIQSIFERYKYAENPPLDARRVNFKMIREVGILILVILVIIFLGGLAGLFAAQVAGAYVEVRWQGFGMAAGFISAIVVSFLIGYTVKWGVGKLVRGRI